MGLQEGQYKDDLRKAEPRHEVLLQKQNIPTGARQTTGLPIRSEREGLANGQSELQTLTNLASPPARSLISEDTVGSVASQEPEVARLSNSEETHSRVARAR